MRVFLKTAVSACFFFLLAASVPAMPASQQQKGEEMKTVKGIVLDENSQPLPGATVMVEGTTRGTQTDLDGAFSIYEIK